MMTRKEIAAKLKTFEVRIRNAQDVLNRAQGTLDECRRDHVSVWKEFGMPNKSIHDGS